MPIQRTETASMVQALLIIVACAAHVSWQATPAPALVITESDIEVVAEERECEALAERVREALVERGLQATGSSSSQKMALRGCHAHLRSSVDVPADVWPGRIAGVAPSPCAWNPALGRASAEAGFGGVRLTVSAEERVTTACARDGLLDLPVALHRQHELETELARRVADLVAPRPPTVRRAVYPHAAPGSPRALLNAAIEAERRGEVDEAFRLAVLASDGRSRVYLDELRSQVPPPVDP